MELNEFKEKIAGILMRTDQLPIYAVSADEKGIRVQLTDGSRFILTCENYGRWYYLYL